MFKNLITSFAQHFTFPPNHHFYQPKLTFRLTNSFGIFHKSSLTQSPALKALNYPKYDKQPLVDGKCGEGPSNQ